MQHIKYVCLHFITSSDSPNLHSFVHQPWMNITACLEPEAALFLRAPRQNVFLEDRQSYLGTSTWHTYTNHSRVLEAQGKCP